MTKSTVTKCVLASEFEQSSKNNNAKPLSKRVNNSKEGGPVQSSQETESDLDLCRDERNLSMENNDQIILSVQAGEDQFNSDRSDYESSMDGSDNEAQGDSEALVHQESSGTDIAMGKSRNQSGSSGHPVFDWINDKESFDGYIHSLIDSRVASESDKYRKEVEELKKQIAEKDKIIHKHKLDAKLKQGKQTDRASLNIRNSLRNKDQLCKSPSDTTLYTPALKQRVDGQTPSSRIINQIASVVENIRVSEERRS